MVGITSFGVYIPRLRLPRKVISGAMGWLSSPSMPGERSVDNYDEDSLTMAVAGGIEALRSVDRSSIDCLFYASTTAPYRERQGATIVAGALGLRASIRTADFANSLKAGTEALLAACDCASSPGTRSVLVSASDCRLAKPGSLQEMACGDGAAAVVVGREKVIASLESSYCVSYDFPDHWRTAGDKFDRTLEDRWIRDEGYSKFIPEAIIGLLHKQGLKATDISKVIYPCIYPRDHATIGKTLGFRPSQIQNAFFEQVGDTSTASPVFLLCAALEDASLGDRILVASYGSGSEALLFSVTPEISNLKKGRVKQAINSRKELTSYEKFLAFRGIMPIEIGLQGEVGPTQLPLAWRERKTILSLTGSKCRRCGTPQFPAQFVCAKPDCGAVNEMEDYSFSDKRASLFSFTEDALAFSMSPPEAYGVVDFEGGGRCVFDITDFEPGSLKVGMPVQMTFRRRYVDEVRGIMGYFWKIVPATAEA